MADVKIRIEANPNAESEVLGDIQNQINNTASSDNVSNVSVKTDSIGVFQDIPSSSGGINGLSLVQDLVFDENGYVDNVDLQGGVLESAENPVEFIWGTVPESREYSVKLVFTNAKNLKDIIVYGDSVVNQFPTQAIVDGSKTIYNDDLQWAINLQEESDTHTIEFTHWNRVNYNACLSYIAVMMKYYEINKLNGLKEIETLNQINPQLGNIFYGIVPNSGSAKLLDYNGEIYDLLNDGIINPNGLKLDVIIGNNIIQHHIVDSSEYSENKELSFDLQNNLSSFSNVGCSMNYIDAGFLKFDEEFNGKDILFDIFYHSNKEDLWSNLNNIANQVIDDNGTTLYDFFGKIKQDYIRIPDDSTLETMLNKFCELTQTNFIEDNNGNKKFVQYHLNKLKNEKVIHIPRKNQFSKPYISPIINNKIDGVIINAIDYKKSTKNLSTISALPETFENISELTSFLQDYSLWVSDEFSDMNSLENAESYDIESYGDWLIVYKTIKPEGYINISSNSVFKAVYSTSETTRDFTDSINLYESIDSFKNFINSNESKNFLAGFLGNNIYVNYQDSYQVIFAIKRTLNNKNYTYNFPLKIFFTAVKHYSDGNLLPAYLRTLNPENKQFSFGDTSNENTTFTFNENPLLTTGTFIETTNGSIPLTEYIATNIFRNYKDGFQSTTLKVSCANYYDENNEILIDWSKNEIFKVGQIVQIDKDNSGNSLFNTKNGNPLNWRIIGVNFLKTGVPMLELELQEIISEKKYNLDELSWEEISAISQTGQAYLYFDIGETKTDYIDGRKVTFQILGFNHDSDENGNKVGITFGLKNNLSSSYNMLDSDSAIADWTVSYMRTYLNSEIFSMLSTKLQNVIKPVIKTSSYYPSSSTISLDKLWLFSRSELYKSYSYFEGNIYAYWKNRENETSYFESWLRTPVMYINQVAPYNPNFFYVNRYGSLVGRNGYSQTSKITFGFCI